MYDALGTDVYDYILQDYPSYVRLSSENYEAKVNYHGYNDYDHMFNDPKLAEEFTKWQKEFKAGQHPLMDAVPFEDDETEMSQADILLDELF
ncbi:hypothetical protein QFX17_00700 [Lactobacillus helveticus]|uniref:hypothetical protein n=1 Tax=Lactobacillus TaxID=1578 RepID=UPI000C7BD668|nr:MULTISPECIES: hypothetical protein [Lactobacillus]AUI75980.1 hypothetical protein Lh22155_04105 [Lactobacillus helveticus]MCO0807607.1 hypothetical protein [Lactobacillus helveticus]MCP9316308.1 hypothetical protein [Lactobacillus helveticus]MDH5816836.1 hypothetical protein [Lactobacillus helveticus]MDN5583864.1 hypothetical protein [Lactobacillus sp.]